MSQMRPQNPGRLSQSQGHPAGKCWGPAPLCAGRELSPKGLPSREGRHGVGAGDRGLRGLGPLISKGRALVREPLEDSHAPPSALNNDADQSGSV